MKNKAMYGVCIFLLITSVIFTGLWLSEKNDLSEVEQLAQSSAYNALSMFKEYRNSNEESCYWYGVAEFRSFQQAYYILVEQTNKQPNYTFCNEVYGYLVLEPERSKTHIDEIIAVMSVLANDVTDENGYLKMSELRNNIGE